MDVEKVAAQRKKTKKMAIKHFTASDGIKAVAIPANNLRMQEIKPRSGWFSFREVWCDALVRVNQSGSLSHIKTSFYKEGSAFTKTKIPKAYMPNIVIVYINYPENKKPTFHFHKSCKVVGWGKPQKSKIKNYLNSSFIIYEPPALARLNDNLLVRAEIPDEDIVSFFITKEQRNYQPEYNAVPVISPNYFFKLSHNEFRYLYADSQGWVLDGEHITPKNEAHFDILGFGVEPQVF